MMHYVVLLPLITLSLLLGGIVAMSTWQRRTATGAQWLLATVAFGAVWFATFIVDLVVSDPSISAWLNAGGWIGASLLALVWFAFALEYTGRRNWLVPSVLAVLAIVPLTTIILVFLEHVIAHGLVRDVVFVSPMNGFSPTGVEYGSWGLVQLAYTYVLVAISSAVLLELVIESDEANRFQGIVLIAVAVVPLLTNAVGIAGLSPAGGVDPTPLSFGVSAALLLVAIRRHRLFDAVPVPTHIAYHAVFESLETPVVVLNAHHRVVQANRAAAILHEDGLDAIQGVSGDRLPGVLGYEGDDPAIDPTVDIDIDTGYRSFQLRSMPLTDRFDRRYGTILVYQDITDLLAREQRLDVLNRVLRHDIRNEMTVVLGHARDGVAAHPEASEAFGSIEETAQSIIDTSETARHIEQLVGRARAESVNGTVASMLDDVRTKLRRTHPSVGVQTAVGVEDATPVPSGLAAVIWQLVDNAARHNPLDERTVTVSVDGDAPGATRWTVSDNGPGIPHEELRVFQSGEITALDHASGLGLWLVHWVVAAMGGHVHVDVDDGGTAVSVVVPTPDDSTGASRT